MKNFLTISQTAKMLGVNKETLRRWDNSGKFKPQRHPINNYRVYNLEQIDLLANELKFECEIEKNKTLGTPYFKTDYGSLYNLDIIEFFKNLDKESIDLIIADPPYNIKKAEWDSFQSQKQYVEWSLEWIKEAQRVLKPNGTLYVCGFSEILADIKWAANYLFKGCKWLVWYYRNKANMGNDWGRSHESLLHFRKSKNLIFNIDEARVPYNAHTLRYPLRPQADTSQYGNGKKYIWQPNPNGAKPKDVFEIPTLSNGSWVKTIHLTQKPVELIRKCVLVSSNKDSIIVDPFGGSGTTYAVAEAYGRNWLGTETNIEYCEIIKQRLLNKIHIERIALGKDEFESVKRRQKLRS